MSCGPSGEGKIGDEDVKADVTDEIKNKTLITMNNEEEFKVANEGEQSEERECDPLNRLLECEIDEKVPTLEDAQKSKEVVVITDDETSSEVYEMASEDVNSSVVAEDVSEDCEMSDFSKPKKKLRPEKQVIASLLKQVMEKKPVNISELLFESVVDNNKAPENGNANSQTEIAKDGSTMNVDVQLEAGSSNANANENSCMSSEMEERVETNSEETGGAVFRRPKRKLSNRNFRSRSSDGDSSADEPEQNESSSVAARDQSREGTIDWETSLSSSSSSTSSFPSTNESNMFDTTYDVEMMEQEDDPTVIPRVMTKPKPRHKWFVVQEVINRQIGASSKYVSAELFRQRCYGSLHCVSRLELMYKLEVHRGCVNTLNFNESGTLLATASDDRKVAVWNWALGKCLFTYESGHSSNVFQAKFLPLSGDRHIVSCARDGQVRLALLTGLGGCRSTRQLANHRRPAHKIATHLETPHVFLSAGEDAVVYSLDVRDYNNKKLLTCKQGNANIALYSISSNPINSNEFCVTGEEKYIRLYDRRKIGTYVKRFCPQHLLKLSTFIHITCAVFNYNGTEILGSYNDEDIYLFDTRHSEGSDYVHRYEGHRNSVTVKGVNFFGPRSEYIVSGSDCGNVFFWDKHTESIVQWMRGDEEGVVNCLEPHPRVPIIATSGLDYDIKVWVPSCEQEPTFDGLKTAVSFNEKARDDNKSRRQDPWDNHMQWLWRQIRNFERRRNSEQQASRETAQGDGVAAEGEDSSSEEETGGTEGNPGCSPS